MTARTSIASYLALAALAAFAASVPQTSADKYYFTVPLHPGGIQGTVMGDPPAYRAMRSEDISWLNEAAAERRALMTGTLPYPRINLVPEFGQWPMSATNGFRGWTTAVFYENGASKTNIVARYAYKTNDLSGSVMQIQKGPAVNTGIIPYANRGQAGGRDYIVLTGLGIQPEKLISDSKVKDVTRGWPSVTNVTTLTVTNWTGRYMENGQWRESVRANVSYITMPMTNGAVSVYTNSWTEILPHVETAHITNIVESSIEGLMFNGGVVEYYEPEKPRDLDGPFWTGGIIAWYDVLAKAKYNIYRGSSIIKTNETDDCYFRFWPKDDISDQDTVTNTIPRGTFGSKTVEGTRSVTRDVELVYEEKEDEETGIIYDELVDIKPADPDEDVYGTIDDSYCSSSTYNLYTGLPYGLVNTGGVNRIKSATLFAAFGVTWHQDWSLNGRVEGEYVWHSGYTNVHHYVMFRIGNVQEINGGVEVYHPASGTTNRYVAFGCTMNMKDLLESAARLSGYAFPSYGFGPTLKYPCPEAYIDKPSSDPYEWEYGSGHSMTHEEYTASMSGAYLVIEFQPWTSLPEW